MSGLSVVSRARTSPQRPRWRTVPPWVGNTRSADCAPYAVTVLLIALATRLRGALYGQSGSSPSSLLGHQPIAVGTAARFCRKTPQPNWKGNIDSSQDRF